MKSEALPNIDFADSKFKSFQMLENNDLIICMESWDEKKLQLLFSDTIHFSYKLGDFPKNLYINHNIDPFLLEAIQEKYEKIPTMCPYNLYQLEDIHNFPFIKVVAKSINVINDS